MADEINELFAPQLLSSFRENVPPVQCTIWKGKNEYETITLQHVYPFDTIDTIKRMICAANPDNPAFIPRFTFVGIPQNGSSTPTIDTTYLPIDYLWYSNESHDPSQSYIMAHPLKALAEGDERFVTSDGSYASPNYEPRGRSTIEDILMAPYDGQIPTLHVFPLRNVLKEYRGVTPMPQEDWNRRFAGYYPEVKMGGPYQAAQEDIDFSKKIQYYLSKRETTLHRLNQFLEDNERVPLIEVTGIKQLRLTWKKPVDGFEGSASMFYQIPVTDKRPYMRLLPSEGSAITKLHVKGILPIPTLDDPRVLEGWGQEITLSQGSDLCMIKYIHRPSIGITQPIYGTIHVQNDGTMNLMLQPPKNIRSLDPNLDFRNFRAIIEEVFDGLPQPANVFELREIALTFSLVTSMKSKRFTKARLVQRLPYFQTFFYEIESLPNENPLISLRYKAVSQYASEDRVFSFLTQFATRKNLDGELPDTHQLIEKLQEEFGYSVEEAKRTLTEWSANRSTFTLQLPEDGEFIESFNPGIDIHIHAQHPAYHIHVHRIDSYASYLRIYTLLSLLFMEDDEYYRDSRENREFIHVEEELEQESMLREHTGKQEAKPSDNENTSLYDDVFQASAAEESMIHGMMPNNDTASVSSLYNDPFGEIQSSAPLAAQAAPVAAQAAQAAPVAQLAPKKGPKAAVEQDDELKLIDPTSWFIKKLQEIDKRLFKYTTDPSDKNGYSRKCAGNEDRQPAVLTKDQYDRMREIYEDDPIVWIEYPLTGTSDPQESFGKEETVTVMRFGSSTDTIRYYFCPQYFCLVDEIMIRPVDFESSVDRDGNRKPANSCPFCRGKLITNRKKATQGHTVMKRENKPKSDKYHQYIDFLSKTSHPEKFSLPCCFTTQSTLRVSDPSFAHLRSYLQEDSMEKIMDEPQEEYEELLYQGDRAIEYSVLLQTIHKRYILESNKQPEPGTFATAPGMFDAFFGQHSGEQLVKRSPMLLKLRPNAQGFLRVGTENTLNESLLGVIAPLLNRNTISDVKERILEVVIPRIFINCHFGNLVLEFYDPTDGRTMPSTQMELMTWSQTNLGITVTSKNRYALLRIYNAYHQFVLFIKDPSKRKDLRHIQPLLAEPGLFTTRGLQLLIMDEHGAEPVTIKCPTFGVSMDRNRKNDIAFISRSVKDSVTTSVPYIRYELYVHTSNRPAKGGELEIHESIVRWDHASRRYWPEMVRKRVEEYMTQCESRYRTLYTSQQGVHSMAMIPLSKAIEATLFSPDGIIKDSYNHLVGVTFRIKAGSSWLVALPIVDDGIVSISSTFSIKNIYLDWDEFKAAPVDDVIAYYQKELEPLFSLYPGYRVKHIARRGSDIVAIQLENGLYVPVNGARDEAALDSIMKQSQIRFVSIKQLEWEVDRELAGMRSKQNEQNWKSITESRSAEDRCGTDQEIMRTTSYRDWEESYQQFRLMVSNWMNGEKGGPSIRKGTEEIIFNMDLPEYERRKRLYIFLSSTLMSWFYPDRENWDKGSITFLRKDCRLIESPDACSGSCYWKEDEGKCLLHVTETTELSDTVGERTVSTSELYTKRVIDELVRFPIRRKQLMKRGELSTITAIIEPIRDGDQYIIPESSPTWTNLLRLDWAKVIPEDPKYYEEQSRQATENDQKIPEGELPDELKQLLGENTRFRLRVPPTTDRSKPLLPFTAILGITLDQLKLNENAPRLTKSSMIEYVRYTTKPIGMINLTGNVAEDEKEIMFTKPFSGIFHSVCILVFLPNRVGILIEEDGIPMVSISKLPDPILQRWKQAGLVQLRLKEPHVEEKMPIEIGKNPPVQAVPLVVQAAQKIKKGPRIAPK